MKYADSQCRYTEQFNPHCYVYTGKCVMTGEQCSVTVPAEGLYKYRQGALIQDAFPDMPETDREFLISGLSDEAFKAIYE